MASGLTGWRGVLCGGCGVSKRYWPCVASVGLVVFCWWCFGGRCCFLVVVLWRWSFLLGAFSARGVLAAFWHFFGRFMLVVFLAVTLAAGGVFFLVCFFLFQPLKRVTLSGLVARLVANGSFPRAGRLHPLERPQACQPDRFGKRAKLCWLRYTQDACAPHDRTCIFPSWLLLCRRKQQKQWNNSCIPFRLARSYIDHFCVPLAIFFLP